jgi:hypothetical protein
MSSKRRRKESKIQEFMYRDTTYMEYEMYDYNGNKWSHQSSNKGLNKNLVTIPGKHSIDSLQKMAILGTSHSMENITV